MELPALHLDLPVTRISGVIDFYSSLYGAPRGIFDVPFTDSITDHMPGSCECCSFKHDIVWILRKRVGYTFRALTLAVPPQ